MAKTKKPGRGKPQRSGSKAKSAAATEKVRNKVIQLVLGKSEDMAKRVIASVTEGGQVAALKYLWEMSGLFPCAVWDDGEERESLAQILLERMGLQGKDPVRPENDEGDVESDEELPAPD